MRMLLVCLSLVSTAAHARGSASDDICVIRPDLCDDSSDAGSVADLTRQARRSVRAAAAARRPASARAPRPATAVNTAPKASPAREVRAARPAPRSITCRPESVAITAANANEPICGSAPSADPAKPTRDLASVATVSPGSAVDFNSYMQSNSRNPALSRRIDGYQTAFRETARPTTFVAPDVEGSGVREGAGASATRNNN